MKTFDYILKLLTDIALWVQVPENEAKLVDFFGEVGRARAPVSRIVDAVLASGGEGAAP
jgi:hypothetical protein